jgi:selenocysteine-specific elongation factor
MIRAIVGTAGHIDHGKTALIGALTGEETDRLPEEKRRGISIDLGFSHLDVDDGALGIVDVPGHEDFIRNMLAGTTGMDAVLLVVAADEGVMPQTREHVAIAGLLGVPTAVVALTKTDLVDDDWLALARDDVAGFLADTPFADAPIVETSAVTGRGLDALRDALVRGVSGSRGRPDDLFRMPVDRSFTVRGTGTVVTGTVWSGRLERDTAVRLLPGETDARVRGLQVHGGEVGAVEAGQRAALALAGVDRAGAGRGLCVVADPAWVETSMLTVSLRVLPTATWRIEQRQRLRVHLGTAEVMARVALLDRDPLEPGDMGWAQLRLEAPTVARRGDRFVVRSYSPVTTIGGGVVAEPVPARRSRLRPGDGDQLRALADGDATDALRGILDGAGVAGVLSARLPVLLGATPAEVDAARTGTGAVEAGERVFAPDALAGVKEALTAAVAGHHRERPLQKGMDAEAVRRAAPDRSDPALVQRALESLVEDGALVRDGDRVAIPAFRPTLSADQERLRDRLLAELDAAGAAPPRADDLARSLGTPAELHDVLSLLEDDGRLVRLEHDLYMSATARERVIRDVVSALGGRDDVSPGEFREVLGVSRRHLIPLLEHLDRIGLTVRSGAGRRVL